MMMTHQDPTKAERELWAYAGYYPVETELDGQGRITYQKYQGFYRVREDVTFPLVFQADEKQKQSDAVLELYPQEDFLKIHGVVDTRLLEILKLRMEELGCRPVGTEG